MSQNTEGTQCDTQFVTSVTCNSLLVIATTKIIGLNLVGKQRELLISMYISLEHQPVTLSKF